MTNFFRVLKDNKFVDRAGIDAHLRACSFTLGNKARLEGGIGPSARRQLGTGVREDFPIRKLVLG